jgi:hypothetical protein
MTTVTTTFTTTEDLHVDSTDTRVSQTDCSGRANGQIDDSVASVWAAIVNSDDYRASGIGAGDANSSTERQSFVSGSIATWVISFAIGSKRATFAWFVAIERSLADTLGD